MSYNPDGEYSDDFEMDWSWELPSGESGWDVYGGESGASGGSMSGGFWGTLNNAMNGYFQLESARVMGTQQLNPGESVTAGGATRTNLGPPVDWTAVALTAVAGVAALKLLKVV